MISQFPRISAIYYGLLQSGYDYYTYERSADHIRKLQTYCRPGRASAFFSGTRQNTCDVYPYWPRAFILETATFFLNDRCFQDFGVLRRKIMSAGNIAENERNDSLWTWLAGFPQALDAVLSDDSFSEYLEWEGKWISEQKRIYRDELHLIRKCLETCTERYHSPAQQIRICINPIKCVYSSDYHLSGDCFVFSSGALRTDSVIHEFLHHVVHPFVEQQKTLVLKYKPINDQIDQSYYLSEDDAGLLNAFEETVVRSLTEEIMKGKYPENIPDYLESFLTQKQSGKNLENGSGTND